MAGVHLPFEGASKVDLALLNLLAGGGEHRLGETHGLKVGDS